MTEKKPLIVYKASAGSGKTFTLATEYIKLVVRNPQDYRKILAVTFTNKATEEMKTRILSQLYGIANRLPSSNNYMEAVCEALDVSQEYVIRQAEVALYNLLHNYSYFKVGTIDSFFQSVLRNLARELDLTATLRVGLNDTEVEEMAVDQLIENLSANDAMLQWILKYVMDSINEDHSWNIIRQVKTFGKTIFKDYYKTESKRLNDIINKSDFFDKYTGELNAIIADTTKQMKIMGEAFVGQLKNEGISTEDLAYGLNGVVSPFLKLQNGEMKAEGLGKRAEGCIDAPERWLKKGIDGRDRKIAAITNGPLMDMLRKAQEYLPKRWRQYQSAKLTLKHLNQLRLLESIEQKVRELNEGSNRFLLSDTQYILHELIENSDSPFIYEKIGTQLEHIMIDEFQDTSTIQWKNFKVLLQDTMSHEGTENLIVGDVKQSIYRWRSGDWRLLNNIQAEFPQGEKQLDIRSLSNNYRSTRRIIEFNNAFFKEASRQENIAAYNDVRQEIPKERQNIGYVSVTLYPNDDYQERVLTSLTNTVKELIENGISLQNIAILVRANKYVPLIANHFMEKLPEIPIVSDEAFRLEASSAVQVIIQALRLLVNPNDIIAKAFLAKMYSHRQLHGEVLDNLLPEAYTKHYDELLRLPLYDLTEQIYTIFELNKLEGQSAYLCAFYDYVANYVNDQLTDITLFLREWDESISTKTIQSPSINGIRLISIHKSKGLEFAHVLVPFCDWKLEQSDILWCKPQEAPFNKLPIVPIDYSKSGMEGTIYYSDYQEESTQYTVDNMNLLYVAFTRAEQSLHVWGKRGGNGHRSVIIEKVVPTLTEELKDNIVISGASDEKAPFMFEYGELATLNPTKNKQIETEQNIFLQNLQPLTLTIETGKHRAIEFKQSNQSRLFAANEEEQQQTNYILLGSILHNIFSTIKTKDDVESALKRLELDGVIYDKYLTKEHIEELIHKRIESPLVAKWYDKKWTLFNECNILYRDPNTGAACKRRPDRVMTDGKEMIVIDFKFGRPRDEYKEQVGEYMNLLTAMGYPNVKGYLWYVYSNKIEEVK